MGKNKREKGKEVSYFYGTTLLISWLLNQDFELEPSQNCPEQELWKILTYSASVAVLFSTRDSEVSLGICLEH